MWTDGFREWDHEHECRKCGQGIECNQSDAECDRNGGIGQYNGQCDDCNRREAGVTRLIQRMRAS